LYTIGGNTWGKVGKGGNVAGFRGRHSVSMDSKGRVSVPAPFRSRIDSRLGEPALILTLHMSDACLRIYPLAEWERIEATADSLADGDPDVDAYKRHFIGSARECELDRQGRILIPPEYREYAGLKGSVVFIGLGSKMEVWDKDSFQSSTEVVDRKNVMQSVIAKGGIM